MPYPLTSRHWFPTFFWQNCGYFQALKSLQRLRNTDLQAARDVYYIYRQLTGEIVSRDNSSRIPAMHTPVDMVPQRLDSIALSTDSNVPQTPLGIRSYITRFKELFKKNRVRQATLAASTVMMAQQACGSKSEFSRAKSFPAKDAQVNIMSFYSSTIFKSARNTSNIDALWCSWGWVPRLPHWSSWRLSWSFTYAGH